jgi:hypothetical protein
VHNRDDENEIGFNRIQNAVRKDARETTPNILLKYWPSRWRFQNPPDRVFYGIYETKG